MINLRSPDHADGSRLDRFAATDRTHVLGCLRLDAYLIEGDPERAGDALAHRRDVRRELGCLRDDGRIDVAEVPPCDFDAPRSATSAIIFPTRTCNTAAPKS